MDLGIAGRKAIVCASSRGLGRGCAIALAEAGCEVVVNGRDPAQLARAAAEIQAATGARVIAVAADISTREGQDKLFAACPEPDILVNNNGGPPFRDFRELDRDKLIDGVVANMVTPIELIRRAIDPMVARRFGRIVNITSSSVKAPISGLDLSSGARAGLTAFLAGVARTVAGANVTINQLLPGSFDTDRQRAGLEREAAARGIDVASVRERREAAIPAKRFGTPQEFGAACAFLCSAQAGYITGQNLLIDGGSFPRRFLRRRAVKHELRSVSTPADWQAMHDIRRATLFTEERHPGVVYDENHPLDRDPAHQPFLLLLDGTPIGVVRLDWRGREAVVRLVGILPQLQGQGHGRAMGDLVDAVARRRGVARLLVNAYHGALGFYERTGWHREEWDTSELTGIAGDCIQMTKSIGV